MKYYKKYCFLFTIINIWVSVSQAIAQNVSPSPDESIRFYTRRNHPVIETTKAYNGYFGIEGGFTEVSGNALPLNAGFAYGITLGLDTPVLGYGFSALHESLPVWNSSGKESITQWMVELNLFSYLLLNGGIHAGDVVTSIDNSSSNSLGLGLHAGFDLHFTHKLTAGIAASWTFVVQNENNHSLLHLIVPLKYWF